MECILIGTGGMMPMSYRMLTSLAVRLNGQIYLFDAGEGTQINWKRARLGVRGLKLIAVTHLHADHCLGIPGMIMLRAQMENPDPLTILGPPGTREFLSQSQRTLEYHVNFPIHIIEWASDNSDLAYQDESGQDSVATGQAHPLLPGIQVRRAGQAGKIRQRAGTGPGGTDGAALG